MRKIRIKNLMIALAIIGVVMGNTIRPMLDVQAENTNCPSLRIIFARGSGGTRWEDKNYLAYKNTIEEKIRDTGIDYEFIDLDYPAVAVGMSDAETFITTLGAYIGSGEAYRFGESVATGVTNLTHLVNDECPGTKYVLGGYSQGAMVVSKSLANLNPEKIIYAATFGDPKIYLPEGKGTIPPACRNENLSDYRMYVPDCQAYKGMLGAVMPYEPEALVGKVGTWCNRYDVFCSSRLNTSDHVAYVSENLYDDAAKVINAKVTKEFGVENNFTSLHDTAIVIDSTQSMMPLIDKFKREALRLTEKTLASGGRVALYDYRDLSEAYHPVEHCGFTTCTVEKVIEELDKIEAEGGGDNAESLLSATLQVMREQKWQQGATKSIVLLTDAGFHNPDLDGTTMDEVVALSKSIDPVNFYIITKIINTDIYKDLATRTDGKVVTNLDSLSSLTDYIMKRYDSLPRVDERSAFNIAEENASRPTLNLTNIADGGEKADISWSTDGEEVLVTMNDALLGKTSAKSLIVGELDRAIENTITLIPVKNGYKGESIAITLKKRLDGSTGKDEGESRGKGEINQLNWETRKQIDDTIFFIPKAPNTGRGPEH